MGTRAWGEAPWISSYEPGVSDELAFEETCLPGFLKKCAEERPEAEALLFEGRCIRYGELWEAVERLSVFLAIKGIGWEDRVAILLPNLVPCVVAYYAVLNVGAVVVMNNPLYSDRELEKQFNDSGAELLITLDLLASRMIALKPRTPFREIVYTSIGDYLPPRKRLLFRLLGERRGLSRRVEEAEGVTRWTDAIRERTVRAPEARLSFDDVAMFQYTGGTTGVAKAAVLTHGNLSRQIQQIAAWFPSFRKWEERMLGALPFFHMFGVTTAMNFSVFMGWCNVLVPKPQPDLLLKAIRRHRPTFTPFVPTMLIGMLNHPDLPKTDLRSIKGCFSGGASLPGDVIREFEERTGALIVEGYGMTECSPATHINPFRPEGRRLGSVGLPLPETGCRIVDPEDPTREMPAGEAGEMMVQGPQVMREYLNTPEETRCVKIGGWLRTGDIARMDEDGYFYIVDRKKHVIISGGYNVYPRDIEEVLFGHPKVLEACCVGIPHPSRGEAVKAYVVLKQGERGSQEELLEHCRTRLAKYKWPVEIEFLDDLPKTQIGKIQSVYLAYHDVYTGLKNRKAFLEAVRDVSSYSGRYGKRRHLVLVQVPGFRAAVRRHGYEVRAGLSSAIASRLKETVRATDSVFRIDTDTFAVILNNPDDGRPSVVGDKLGRRLREPYTISGETLEAVGARIGIATVPEDGTTAEELLQGIELVASGPEKPG